MFLNFLGYTYYMFVEMFRSLNVIDFFIAIIEDFTSNMHLISNWAYKKKMNFDLTELNFNCSISFFFQVNRYLSVICS